MIVDYAVYEEGARREGELALEDVYEACRVDGSFAWVGLHEPTAEELDRGAVPISCVAGPVQRSTGSWTQLSTSTAR